MTQLTAKDRRAVYDVMNAFESLGTALGKLTNDSSAFISDACDQHSYLAAGELWTLIVHGHLPGIPGRHVDFIAESIRWKLTPNNATSASKGTDQV